MHRTATKRCGFVSHWRHNSVVAVESALPVAVGDLYRHHTMPPALNDLPKLVRTFRFLGWAFLVFGTFALIHCIRALIDPAATLNVNRLETSDPGTKLRATLGIALFPIVGLILAFLPWRFFERLYARNKEAAERLFGSRRKD